MMSPPCAIVVRRARAADEPARADLVRRGVSSHHKDAFLLFFFQELTLQWCVLAGAVLFIFCGVGAMGVLGVLPAAALAVAAGVLASHLALADKQIQKMRQEVVGYVAEYRGPLVLDPNRVSAPVVVNTEDGDQLWTGFKLVVGTVSVSETWGDPVQGWMHALAVHPQWRRRGIGRALVQAARARCGALQCVVGELQHAARQLLHSDGWEARGWYHRAVCGRALTLQLAHLTAPPPPPPPPLK